MQSFSTSNVEMQCVTDEVTQTWALPPELLQKVLSCVGVKERLTSCALVCQDWKRAAIAATTHIVCYVPTSHSFQCWLEQHSPQISSMQVMMAYPPASPRNSDSRWHSAFEAAAGAQDLLDPFAALELQDSAEQQDEAGEFEDHFLALEPPPFMQLVTEQPMPLEDTILAPLHEAEVTLASGRLDSYILPPHLHLTSLELQGVTFATSGFTQRLAQMTSLKTLKLVDQQDAAVLRSVQHLQHLETLHLAAVDIAINADTLPGFHDLTALSHLAVISCKSFDVQLLAGLTQLQHLELRCKPLKCQGQTQGTTEAAAAAAGNKLLSVLPKLQHLTHLSLQQLQHTTGSPTAYTALTSFNCLQHLDLSFAQLPQGAWQQLFSPPHQHSRLRTLELQFASPKLTTQQLECLVEACPQLVALGLEDAVQQGVQLHALQQLVGLTKLHVDAVGGDDTATQLAQLTGLRHLHMFQYDSAMTDAGRLQLTALQHLTYLLPARHPASAVALVNQAAAGCPPDVSAQLLRECLQPASDSF